MNQRISINNLPRRKKFSSGERFCRRLTQVKKVLFDKSFANYHSMQEAALAVYDHPEEVQHWARVADFGLEPHEARNIELARKKSNGSVKRILVIGCGAGRECFALAKQGYEVVGVDTSAALIAHALKHKAKLREEGENCSVLFKWIHPQKLDVLAESMPTEEQAFDLIYTTNILLNLIPGEKNRRQFLQDLHLFTNKHARLIFFVDYLKLNPSQRFYWISQLLRLRAFLSEGCWQEGDTASGLLTNYSSCLSLVYYYYYPSLEKIKKEFALAGFDAEPGYGIGWILTPIAK